MNDLAAALNALIAEAAPAAPALSIEEEFAALLAEAAEEEAA